MLSIFVAATLALQTPKYPADPPAIMVYWEPGHTFPSPGFHIDVAIWEDGRAIWREPRAKYERQKDGHWILNKGRYYAATLKPNEVRAAMEQLEKQGILGKKFESYILVDGNFTEQNLRYRGMSTSLAANGGFEPNPTASNAAEARKSRNAWLGIDHAIKLLIPRKGTPTVEPPTAVWINWLRPEN